MSFTPYSGPTNYISSLDDQPNDVGGLTPAQLKQKFDQFGADWVTWFNATHLNQITLPLLGGSGKQMMDNWDWRGVYPNQRGLSVYNTAGYTFDRWRIESSAITLTQHTGYATCAVTAAGHIWQVREAALITGKAYTFSVMDNTGAVYSMPIIGGTDMVSAIATNINLHYWTGVNFGLYFTGAASINIAAWKLESGSVSTLANDAPADYGEELRKCQRYYIRFKGSASYTPFCIGHGISTDAVRALFNFPVEMRVPPTSISYSAVTDFQKSFGSNTMTSITLASQSSTKTASVDFVKASEFSTNGCYMITGVANSNAWIAFEGADL